MKEKNYMKTFQWYNFGVIYIRIILSCIEVREKGGEFTSYLILLAITSYL